MATMIPDNVEQFTSKGVFSSWIPRDYQNKNPYDITTNSVAVSTIHSAKGLDYACVFLIVLDTFDENKLSINQIERLTYVGITRARYQLYIPYAKNTPLIENLLSIVRNLCLFLTLSGKTIC